MPSKILIFNVRKLTSLNSEKYATFFIKIIESIIFKQIENYIHF